MGNNRRLMPSDKAALYGFFISNKHQNKLSSALEAVKGIDCDIDNSVLAKELHTLYELLNEAEGLLSQIEANYEFEDYRPI